jgi:hypothetical protein
MQPLTSSPQLEKFTTARPATANSVGLVRYDWLLASIHLPGKALHLALMLLSLSTVRRSASVRPGRKTMAQHGLSRDACYDGLKRLQAAGLVRVWRLPGRTPNIALLEPGTDQFLWLDK